MKKSVQISGLLASLLMLAGCSEKYYSMEDFGKTKKIDAHTHLNSKNTTFAKQAQKDNFLLLSINTDIPEEVSLEEQFDAASFLQNQFPENIRFLTSFTLADWDSADWAFQTIDKLKTDFSNGAVGVKIWKNIGMTYKDSTDKFIMIDNPKFDTVFNFIASQNKPVLGHLGEPKNCWLPVEKMTVNNDREYYKNHPEYHMFLHPEFPSYEEQIKARDNFLEKNPGLCFVGAHLASLEWSTDELAKRLDKFPNMAVDLADRICHLQLQSQNNYEKIRNFILKYQNRIMYSTDSGYENISPEEEKTHAENLHKIWVEDWRYFVTDEKMTNNKIEGEFRALNLPAEVVDKIFYLNAFKLYKFNN